MRRNLPAVALALAALALVLWLALRDDEPRQREDGGRPSGRAMADVGPDAAGAARREGVVAPPDRATSRRQAAVGGALHGRVIDSQGTGYRGVVVTLVDRDGAPLDTCESDGDGVYEVDDDDLVAAALRFGGVAHPILPLRSGERRELDLVIGNTRRVHGFVTDLEGEPVAGARVHLRPREFEGTGWWLLTDRGGAFATTAPTSALRIDGDGGALGVDSAYVGAGSADRAVDLVLEPSATITIVNSSLAGRHVKVDLRNLQLAKLGEDADWVRATFEADVGFGLQVGVPMPAELAPPDMTVAERQSATVTMQSYPPVIERLLALADGELGVPIPVPADLPLEAVLHLSDGRLFPCGRFVARPGQDLVVPCGGRPRETHVRGRFVDARGRPAPVAVICYSQLGVASGIVTLHREVPVGPDGRFDLRLLLHVGTSINVGTSCAGDVDIYTLGYGRRDVAVAPGVDLDLGDLLWRDGPTSSNLGPHQPLAFLGATGSLVEEGIEAEAIDADGPLEAAGVDPGSVILMIDDEPVAGLGVVELTQRLAAASARAEPVVLRIRGLVGEIYEAPVTLSREE